MTTFFCKYFFLMIHLLITLLNTFISTITLIISCRAGKELDVFKTVIITTVNMLCVKVHIIRHLCDDNGLKQKFPFYLFLQRFFYLFHFHKVCPNLPKNQNQAYINSKTNLFFNFLIIIPSH